jgi:hypothetical protein
MSLLSVCQAKQASHLVEMTLHSGIFVFLFDFEPGSHCVAQAGLELLSSRDAPASASRVARTTSLCPACPHVSTQGSPGSSYSNYTFSKFLGSDCLQIILYHWPSLVLLWIFVSAAHFNPGGAWLGLEGVHWQVRTDHARSSGQQGLRFLSKWQNKSDFLGH